MQMPMVHQAEATPTLLAFTNSSFLSRHKNIPVTIRPRTAATTARKGYFLRVNAIADPFSIISNYKAHSVPIRAVVNVKICSGGLLSGLQDAHAGIGLVGKRLYLELVSAEAGSGEGNRVSGYADRVKCSIFHAQYECTFQLPSDFGEVGAVIVENEHHTEMYLIDIVLSNARNDLVTFSCNSWVHAKSDNASQRIFFTNKSYLPSNTPTGIKKLREVELQNLRGNGQGERKTFDRIYDYDKYNDLGNPDNETKDLARPVLGGQEHPYPRRCRTGRGPAHKDPLSEKTTVGSYYIPRDEAFSAVKSFNFHARTLRAALHALIPLLEAYLVDPNLRFPHFTRIDSLFNEGVTIDDNQGIFKYLLPRLIKRLHEQKKDILLLSPDHLSPGDKFSWFRDEEFARQTLAGLNPLSIQLVTEWPITSKLDANKYGPSESAITEEIVEREIKGIMTVQEAMDRKKLFMLDYHDLLLPYVESVRNLEGTTLYGSRTLFFLCEDGTLKPIAIELTCPPIGDKPLWRHVFTPSSDATNAWLWRFAKVHVTVHDSGYHQLVIHWLRTHCCMETYIIAANRQLSVMHPIYRLLYPHFRYTMEINAVARERLISADGVIESCFSPGKYSVELSSAAYEQLWRFDMEALPADLIRRGMAVEDPTADHGLKLTIADYPYANDGLILWDSIKCWVTEYVNNYYPDAKAIETDSELQAWWTEVRTKGHEDKKDEPWWPVLDTLESLIQTLSTIIWVASGHHAAVNFGQYEYAAYFPNRPTIARTNVPIENPTYSSFMKFYCKPEAELLECFPSQIQATKVMIVLDVLSSHSPDEEYIGEEMEPSWSEDPIIKEAFERFAGKLKYMDAVIDARNADPNLRNRIGAGVVPYELLKTKSAQPGVTGMGVPNSISI